MFYAIGAVVLSILIAGAFFWIVGAAAKEENPGVSNRGDQGWW